MVAVKKVLDDDVDVLEGELWNVQLNIDHESRCSLLTGLAAIGGCVAFHSPCCPEAPRTAMVLNCHDGFSKHKQLMKLQREMW